VEGATAVAGMTTDQLVSVYLKIRGAISQKKEAYEAEIGQLEAQQELIASRLLELCNELNVDTMRTALGTVSRRVKERFWCTDWEAMHRFILEHEAPFLLEQRISNGNMKQFLEENPDLHPVGLQAERKYAVQVRKPTNK
jgi:hypothetical protein